MGRLKRVLRSLAGPRRRRKRTHATDVHPLSPAVLSAAISPAAQSRTVAEGGKPPASPCEPLCAIFLRKPSVYPLSGLKANVAVCAGGVENRMTDALETLV